MSRVRPLPVDFRNLKLSAEEGFVLSRIEGGSNIHELVTLTGFDEGRIVTILQGLANAGAVEVEGLVAMPDLPAFDGGGSEEKLLDGEPAGGDADACGVDAEVDASAAAPLPDGEPAEEDELAREGGEREYRRIYETVYHPLTKDQRVHLASQVEGADLLALCLDAEAAVIQAVVANGRAGLDHARMIAFHHRTSFGLEALAKRMDLLRDALVQRRLLRNPAVPATLVNRIATPRIMLDVYKIVIDREIPERSRILGREILRKKFTVASSDEKASLLFKTDGRCLMHLVQCSLDAHATQILCGKTGYSLLFVQNLARWSATPPSLIAHLLRLPIVRGNVGIKKMLMKHPNATSEAKRNA